MPRIIIQNYSSTFMVTFVCSYCDATLKKKQTQKHAYGSCRPASFICIDCHHTFTGNDYKTHTSCLTEFEKHWGEYAKPSQKSKNNQQQPVQQSNPQTSQQTNSHKKQEISLPAKQKEAPVDKAQEVHPEQEEKTQQDGWKGWKNQIKNAIKSHGNKVLLEKLESEVLKRYKSFGPEQDGEEADLQQLFQQKLGKVKKVKRQTYVLLQ